ncbi:MAG: hypothetical protein ABSE73_13430 [Planctomycetota bacterium]
MRIVSLSLLLGAGLAVAGDEARKIVFGSKEALAGWTITGDVAIDPAKAREGQNSSLKVAAGGKALLKLRDKDESGKVEIWVYDDCALPEDVKAHRAGPRWGLVQNDGRVFAVAILYADYLGGNEGYTASACDGAKWFDQLCWLGVNRAPAAWHKWTFDFDPEAGLQVFHNDKEVKAVDASKLDLAGFSAIAIWGDDGKGKEQTIWVSDLSVTLGGPTKFQPVAAGEADPYDEKAIAADAATNRPMTIYTQASAPAAPKLEDLPLKDSVSQYGITWTFDQPARAGQFINGDWYVAGPVAVKAIEPRPLYGNEISKRELDHMDKERKEEQRVRNGFMLNPPAQMKVSYDSGVRNWFDPALIQKLPVALKPGDALVSTISMPKGLVLHAQLRNKIERGQDDSSPIRTAAVLTCVAEPQPADAFRPPFCHPAGTDSQLPNSRQLVSVPALARNLKRELLPSLEATAGRPKIEQYIRFTQRPWVASCFFGFEEPVENMPQYGQEVGRVSGVAALMLCSALKPEQKEHLLVNYVQMGIDLGGMIRAGHPGWTGWGGHGSGRKLPIVIAGLLLGDEQLANINQSFPKASFGEDEQTAYGDCWTGAKVVFAGHSGIDAATGVGRNQGRGNPWGPYEHLPPAQWGAGQKTSEAYRRANTSGCWVAEALALRLLHAEKTWGHEAFFDYVDRWMNENDDAFVQTLKEAIHSDYHRSPFGEFPRQGFAWDQFAGTMWAKYRSTLQAPTDGWKQKHDDTYYRTALEKPAGGKTK